MKGDADCLVKAWAEAIKSSEKTAGIYHLACFGNYRKKAHRRADKISSNWWSLCVRRQKGGGGGNGLFGLECSSCRMRCLQRVFRELPAAAREAARSSRSPARSLPNFPGGPQKGTGFGAFTSTPPGQRGQAQSHREREKRQLSLRCFSWKNRQVVLCNTCSF